MGAPMRADRPGSRRSHAAVGAATMTRMCSPWTGTCPPRTASRRGRIRRRSYGCKSATGQYAGRNGGFRSIIPGLTSSGKCKAWSRGQNFQLRAMRLPYGHALYPWLKRLEFHAALRTVGEHLFPLNPSRRANGLPGRSLRRSHIPGSSESGCCPSAIFECYEKPDRLGKIRRDHF
jgi:hypothetical protein